MFETKMKMDMKIIMNFKTAKTKKKTERNQIALEGGEKEDTKWDEDTYSDRDSN